MLKVIPIPKSLSEVVSVTQEFQFNVEGFASNAVTFYYEIGEGPLYWFRIDWYESSCPDQPFVDTTPSVTYENGYPNCPIEITDSCEVMPPNCECYVPCVPGQCIEQNIEVWHMLATSVTHLCYRINNECCNRKPDGFIRRVQQYMRPALCCDVDNFNTNGIPVIDEWVDVDFVDVCECGNLVDPCIATVVYPWHINNCGIHGPVYPGPSITSLAPKQMVAEKVMNKFGAAIPEVLQCHHNLNSIIKGLKQTSLDLHYNKSDKTWRGIQYYRNYKILFEWLMSEELGYKFNLYLEQDNIKSKIMLNVKGGQEMSFVFNIKKAIINKGVLKYKVVQDDNGLFRNFDSLIIKMKG